MDELTEFIKSNPDPRELKWALVVQMTLQNYTYFEIGDVLGVSVGFISKWKRQYEQQGIAGLYLRYQGSRGYLSPSQRRAVRRWLQQKQDWNLGELQQHVEVQYDVVFESKQSYYTLFAEAGISWKKTQKRNPKADPQAVEKKTGNYRVVGAASR